MAKQKLRLSKEEYDTLQQPLKLLYKEDKDSYLFDAEDLDEFIPSQAILKAKKKESDENKELRIKNQELMEKLNLTETSVEDVKTKIDVEKVTNTKRIADLEAKWQQREKQLKEQSYKLATEKIYGDVADIFINKTVGTAIASRRVKIIEEDNSYKTIYLDANGNETDMNFEEFKKNILADKELKPTIKGVLSSGSSASTNSTSVVPKPIKEMNATEKAIFANKFPEEYSRLINPNNQSNS